MVVARTWSATSAIRVAQPTLGRQGDALEQEPGLIQFERVGRGPRLTPAGHALIDHVRAMGDAAARLSMSAYGQNESMAGPVVISASDACSGLLLPPIIAKIRAAEPTAPSALSARNNPTPSPARSAPPAPGSMALPPVSRASARSRNAGDLARADIIGLSDVEMFVAGLDTLGLGLTSDNVTLRCDDFLGVWALVKQGLGLGVIDDRIGDPDPEVARALPGLAPISFPVWLGTHREIRNSPRLRFVCDALTTALKQGACPRAPFRPNSVRYANRRPRCALGYPARLSKSPMKPG